MNNLENLRSNDRNQMIFCVFWYAILYGLIAGSLLNRYEIINVKGFPLALSIMVWFIMACCVVSLVFAAFTLHKQIKSIWCDRSELAKACQVVIDTIYPKFLQTIAHLFLFVVILAACGLTVEPYALAICGSTALSMIFGVISILKFRSMALAKD